MESPDTRPPELPPWLATGARAGALLLVLASLVAVILQDHVPWLLPQGLFNEGRALFQAASWACVVGLSLLAVVFAIELAQGRDLALGRLARGAMVSLLILEGLLFVVDRAFVSGDPDARFGGPYWEVTTEAGTPVFLRKRNAASEFGFRQGRERPLAADVPRLLFLGDSYTEGSGRELACNYPSVVERRLRELSGREVEVWNAGVGGYGPRDALHLLELLEERGIRYDVLVYSLFLENDFTDHLPGTERRVVAGINFRFPESAFLRRLHPLNTRTVRFPLFLVRVGGLTRDETDVVARDTGACRLEGEPLPDVSPGLRHLVTRRLEANYRRGSAYATTGEVERALDALRERARAHGARFVLVVFPDRILVDPVLRAHLGVDPADPELALDRLADFVEARFDDVPRIDVRSLLEGGTHLYRARDTHLNDLGNVRVGEYVAEELWRRGLVPEAIRRGTPPAQGSAKAR